MREYLKDYWRRLVCDLLHGAYHGEREPDPDTFADWRVWCAKCQTWLPL